MTLYALYGTDGKILQSSKVYDPKGMKYDDQLRDHGFQFVKGESPGLLPPDQWYVNTIAQRLTPRPIMRTIAIDKTRIKYGDGDCSRATGIPIAANITVTMRDGSVIHPTFRIGSQKLEISIPYPMIWRVIIELWPYQTFTYDIEAIAP